MILALDFVAQRYGMLPSQLLLEGNSLDIVVAQQAQSYTNRKQEEARAKAAGKTIKPDVPHLTEEQMMEMLRKAKEQAK
jgi:hypothetical protein